MIKCPRTLAHRMLKNFAWAHIAVTGGSRKWTSTIQVSLELETTALCCLLLWYQGARVQGWGKGPPFCNPLWPIHPWQCCWALFCSLSSLKTYSAATPGSCWVTELCARASPGCTGSAQPRWWLVAHFHDNCSFHCNLHPNPRGTQESSKWGWNETRSLPSPSHLCPPYRTHSHHAALEGRSVSRTTSPFWRSLHLKGNFANTRI